MVSYKNTHKRELVDVNRIFKALEYLIEHNPLYKDSEIDRDFLDSCKATDPAGHEFFIGPESSDQNISSPQMDSDDDELFRNINSQDQPMSGANSSSDENEIDKQDKDYAEFVQTDPVRRYQFDYDERVTLADEMPTARRRCIGDN